METTDISGFSWEIAFDGKHYQPVIALKGEVFDMVQFQKSKAEFIAGIIQTAVNYRLSCNSNSRLVLYIKDIAVVVSPVSKQEEQENRLLHAVLANELQKQKLLYNLLTKREKQILKEIDLNLNRSEIAYKLFISPHTVKNHKVSILSKLQLHNKDELLRWCDRYLSYFQ